MTSVPFLSSFSVLSLQKKKKKISQLLTLLQVAWSLFHSQHFSRPRLSNISQKCCIFLKLSVFLWYLSSTHVANGNLYWLSILSLLLLLASLPCSRKAVCAERWERNDRGSQEGEGGREVVEHCSADKLMQQSRLSQQHTPSLAQCLHRLVSMHGCLRDRLPHSETTPK